MAGRESAAVIAAVETWERHGGSKSVYVVAVAHEIAPSSLARALARRGLRDIEPDASKGRKVSKRPARATSKRRAAGR